jgi:hypothetical protein
MNQKTTIAVIVLATILAASIAVMALPFESAEASRENRGGDARGGRGGDAVSEAEGGDATIGDSEINYNDANAGDVTSLSNLADGGKATSGSATGGAGGDATSIETIINIMTS